MVFGTVLRWMVSWIQQGWLIGSVLENVMGTLQGEDAFMVRVRDTLVSEVPAFKWEISVLQAKDYLLAQTRVRAFLRGMRVDWCGPHLPPIVPALGKRPLLDFLDPEAPHTSERELSAHMRRNLVLIEQKVLEDRSSGLLDGESVVVFQVDRDQHKKYLSGYMKDICYTLTTANRYLFVLSVADIEKPRPEHAFCRLVLPSERLSLQGFPTSIASALGGTLAVKAAGNAYPVPLIAACVAPIIAAIAVSQKSLLHWPETASPPQEIDTSMVDSLVTAEGSVKKRPAGRVLKRPSASQSSARAKAPKCAQTDKIVAMRLGSQVLVDRDIFLSSSSEG